VGIHEAPEELLAFLEAFPPGVRKVFLATRSSVLAVAPAAHELIYNAYNAVSCAYSYSGRLKEAFCHVAAYSDYVNLGFNRGAELPDPSAALSGSGARIRHIRITKATDLRAPALKALLRAAVLQGAALGPKSTGAKGSSVIRPTTGGKRRPKRTW
jgi:hypothetical protein